MADLKEYAESLISTTNVDLSGTGQTTLYTVPTGKTLMITKGVLRAGADCGASIITLGRSTALTDFLNSQNLGNIDAGGDAAILQPIPNATPVLNKTYAAGVIIQIDVTTALGGGSNGFDLFGYLF